MKFGEWVDYERMKSWLNFDGYFRVSVRFVAYSLFAGNDTEIHEPNLPKGGSVAEWLACWSQAQ